MFELIRAGLGAWLILMGVASLWFIASDFDRKRREEWLALGLMLPAIFWAVWLAASDMWALAGI